jgi:DNA-binding LacI/PurR family transcriptional regulator
MAPGRLLALSERGLSVPGDGSVVGFDDGEDVGCYNPPLTTIRQDFRAVGRRGIQMLVAQIEGCERAGEHAGIEPELVIRKSTGPCTS